MNFRKFTPQGELHCAAANTKTSSSPTTTASLLSAHNASRQSCAFKEYYLFPSSNNNSYDDSSSSSSFDQEIYISPKSTVYWSQGEVLFKSFDFSKRPGQRVLAALFAYFVCDEVQDRQRGYLTPPSTPSVPGSPSANGTSDFFLSAHRFSPNNLLSSLSSRLVDDDEEEDEEEGGDDNDKSPRLPWSSPPVRALCIILNDSAKFYFDNGKAYTTSFPFSVKNAWPLRVGLMIQADDGSNGSNNTTNKESLPTIFSLLHPLEELRIVSARQCDDNDMDNNNSCNSTTTIYAQGVEVDEGGGDGELCNDDSDKRTNATYATTTATKTSERRGEFGLLQDESILHVSDSHVISYSPRLKKHSIWTYIIRPVVDSTSDKLSAGTHRSSATNAAGRTRRSSRRTSLAEYTSSFETDQAVLTSTAVRQMKSIVHLERRDLLNIGYGETENYFWLSAHNQTLSSLQLQRCCRLYRYWKHV